jgi:hypothetical protein
MKHEPSQSHRWQPTFVWFTKVLDACWHHEIRANVLTSSILWLGSKGENFFLILHLYILILLAVIFCCKFPLIWSDVLLPPLLASFTTGPRGLVDTWGKLIKILTTTFAIRSSHLNALWTAELYTIYFVSTWVLLLTTVFGTSSVEAGIR